MTIQRFPPNTIYLGGDAGNAPTIVADLAASEAITPGMLVERFANAGVNRLRKSTLTGLANVLFALDHPMANKGVDDAYAAGDLVEMLVARPGDAVWALIASGATVAFGAPLSDAGNGYVKAASGVTIAHALETITSPFPTPTRIRIEVG
jgi:hypothetical protein